MVHASCIYAASAPFITLNNESDSIAGARRISRELVMKFDGDSILFADGKGRISYSREGITSLGMRDTLASRMRVKVFGNLPEPVALSGTDIELQDPEGHLDLVLTTDSAGTVSFPKIPSGDYKISARHVEEDFIATDLLITHDYDDTFCIGMDERLFTPYDIKVDQKPLYTGLTELKVSWNIGDEPGVTSFRRYRFFLDVDGNYYDDTEDLYLNLDGLTPGTYTLSLLAQSGFGTFTEPINLEVTIEEVDPDLFAGIGNAPSDTRSPWRYFDLNGIERSRRDLSPGLYIRTDGIRMEKVLIK